MAEILNWPCSIIALFEDFGSHILISTNCRKLHGDYRKNKKIMGGKFMKIKYVHTNSIKDAVETLLMVGNLGAKPQHGFEQSRYSRHERAITFDMVSCCTGSSA